MPSWRDEYILALRDRDEREKASYPTLDDEFIHAFTNLLDRTAALEAEKTANAPRSTDSKPRDPKVPEATSDGTAQVRSDLAEALRSNGQLQSRIKNAEAELVQLRAKTKTDGKLIEDLKREKAYLSRKLRDKEEELRGKTKLLDNTHNEVLSLNIQLNMSEQKNRDLKAENKELIDRWMARMGQEAEEMNRTLQDQLDGK